MALDLGFIWFFGLFFNTLSFLAAMGDSQMDWFSDDADILDQLETGDMELLDQLETWSHDIPRS